MKFLQTVAFSFFCLFFISLHAQNPLIDVEGTVQAREFLLYDSSGDLRFRINADSGTFEMLADDTVWVSVSVKSPVNFFFKGRKIRMDLDIEGVYNPDGSVRDTTAVIISYRDAVTSAPIFRKVITRVDGIIYQHFDSNGVVRIIQTINGNTLETRKYNQFEKLIFSKLITEVTQGDSTVVEVKTRWFNKLGLLLREEIRQFDKELIILTGGTPFVFTIQDDSTSRAVEIQSLSVRISTDLDTALLTAKKLHIKRVEAERIQSKSIVITDTIEANYMRTVFRHWADSIVVGGMLFHGIKGIRMDFDSAKGDVIEVTIVITDEMNAEQVDAETLVSKTAMVRKLDSDTTISDRLMANKGVVDSLEVKELTAQKGSIDSLAILDVLLADLIDPITGPIVLASDVLIQGILTKFGGTFTIDHPLDPYNKNLSHSFVESPDMMNVYNGIVVTDENGEATVELPAYFEALNKDFRYQLTVIGTFAQAIIWQKIRDGRFVIRTDKPNVEVSWQVTGIRNDRFARDNRIKVEVDKKADQIGTLLYDPEKMGIIN